MWLLPWQKSVSRFDSSWVQEGSNSDLNELNSNQNFNLIEFKDSSKIHLSGVIIHFYIITIHQLNLLIWCHFLLFFALPISALHFYFLYMPKSVCFDKLNFNGFLYIFIMPWKHSFVMHVLTLKNLFIFLSACNWVFLSLMHDASCFCLLLWSLFLAQLQTSDC